MQCWQCGASVRPGAKLCIYCGTKLAQDDAPDEAVPGERESGGWSEARGDSPYGAHGQDGRDGRDRGEDYGARREPSHGAGARSRSRDDGWGEERDGERSGPGRRDDAAPNARVAYRRSAGPRPQFAGGDNRPLDPLDDPRAPRSLLKPPTVPRQQEPRRSTHGEGSGRASYTAGEAGSGQSRRGGYEHEGRYYTQGDLGYDPRYDPESGEYDAVADGRRRGARNADDGYGRDDRGRGERGRDSGYGDHGGQRGGWDEPAGRRAPAQDYRGGYKGRGAYDDAPSAEYSAEYPSRYDDAPSAEYSAEYAAEYPAGYSGELDARDNYGRDARAYRGGGYDESAEWERRSPRGRAVPDFPPDESWNLPAISQAQLPATGWTGDWNAAPPARAADMPAGAGRRGAARGAAHPTPKRRRGRGLTAVIVGLVALVAVAVVIVGVSERTAILGTLPGAPHANPHPFVAYTPGPTPTPVPNYKQFSSTNAHYVLNYPGQWAEQTSSQPNTGYDYVDTFTQASPYTAVIVEQAAAFASISDTDIVTAEVNGGQQSGRTFTSTPAAVLTESIGGEQWTRREYDVTDTKTSTTLHMALLTCHHAGRGYAIVLVATPDAFAKDDVTVFKTMLNSFRFAS